MVTPYPELDVRFAASAWGAHLKSSCFDLPALGAFIDAYARKAPEDECDEGIDLSTDLPPGCGEPLGGG